MATTRGKKPAAKKAEPAETPKASPPAKAKPVTDCRIGLALSGGGFRASLYHLGSIRCLEEQGIMEQVEVISTVSGGSIIGAWYLVEMERKLRERPNRKRLEACDEIITEFCERLHLDFRMRALVFYPFFHPIQTLLAVFRLKHAGDTMAKAFDRYLFAPSFGSAISRYRVPRTAKCRAPGCSSMQRP